MRARAALGQHLQAAPLKRSIRSWSCVVNLPGSLANSTVSHSAALSPVMGEALEASDLATGRRKSCWREARSRSCAFFPWYNRDHHHSGIGFLTPERVRTGHAPAIHLVRSAKLEDATRPTPWA